MKQDYIIELEGEGEPRVTELLSPSDSLDWTFTRFQLPLKNMSVGGAVRQLLCICVAAKGKRVSLSNQKEGYHAQAVS